MIVDGVTSRILGVVVALRKAPAGRLLSIKNTLHFFLKFQNTVAGPGLATGQPATSSPRTEGNRRASASGGAYEGLSRPTGRLHLDAGSSGGAWHE